MKKKILMLTAIVAIAGTGVLYALNSNSNKDACSGACCSKQECCTEGSCTDCSCGTECTGDNCECGCSCCE
ncbi:MAG: hypothetical protein IT245_07810 [Bacteroidia bacterium]|nr:hypothetical protein [Bacteroidia bacterium]